VTNVIPFLSGEKDTRTQKKPRKPFVTAIFPTPASNNSTSKEVFH
jgi:hypothetical protein